MITAIHDFFVGLSWIELALIAVAIWYIARHGIPAAFATGAAFASKVVGWWSQIQTAVATDIAVIRNEIDAIKAHVGMPPAPSPPTPPAPPTPLPPASATTNSP